MRLSLLNVLVVIYIAIYSLHFTIAQVFLADLTNAYYVVTVCCLILVFPFRKVFYISWPIIIVSILSMVFSSYLLPDTWLRWTSWLIILFLSGPVFINQKIVKFRKILWISFVYLYALITVVSFLWILLRLPNFGVDEVFIGGGKYFRNGITSHEMILAPIAGITAMFALYNVFVLKSIRRLLNLILFFVSVAVMFMASSRTVLLAFFLTVIFAFVINFKYILKFITNAIFKIVALVSVCLFVVSLNLNLINSFLENNSRLQEKGVANSRQNLIDMRLEDFEKSPLLGAGFYSVSMQVHNKTVLTQRATKGGQFEFGSLYLQTLSTMGMSGIFALLLILCVTLYIGIKYRERNKAKLFLLIFVFLLIHSITEAYAFSAGGVLCMFFWLSIFQVYYLKFEPVKILKFGQGVVYDKYLKGENPVECTSIYL